ncbi:MAG: hypothetical protein JWM59_4710 [Verrucomicrobiales bacterium]|nr:hypothetical protein [Verrucomicrobiales bacterium]
MKPAFSPLFTLTPVLAMAFLGSAAAADEAVPAPVTAARYAALLERQPFRRSMGLPDSLVLSGVASMRGGSVVTVWNRATRESFLVSSTPNTQGWRLIAVTGGGGLKNTEAVIASGSQSITVRFDPERLTPPKLDNMSRPAGRSESQVVVEALLRGLDPLSAKKFEELPAEDQEKFRKSFAGFLDTYPTAPDSDRIEFVRRTLVETAPPPAPASAAPPAQTPVPAPAPGPAPLPPPMDPASAPDATPSASIANPPLQPSAGQ